MLTYGDGVSNIDITKLLQFHKSHGKIATATAVRPPVRFGELIINNKKRRVWQRSLKLEKGGLMEGFSFLIKKFLII